MVDNIIFVYPNEVYEVVQSLDFNFFFGFVLYRHLFRMEVFHFFGWLWIMNFIIALGQCVLAGGFAQWYFTYQKEVREVLSLIFVVVVVILCCYLCYGN